MTNDWALKAGGHLLEVTANTGSTVLLEDGRTTVLRSLNVEDIIIHMSVSSRYAVSWGLLT